MYSIGVLLFIMRAHLYKYSQNTAHLACRPFSTPVWTNPASEYCLSYHVIHVELAEKMNGNGAVAAGTYWNREQMSRFWEQLPDKLRVRACVVL